MLLEVGANWGRWSFAAARLRYRVVAIDPSLEAALAGARIARQLKLPVMFVAGDARHLPFRSEVFDVVFSYSVLQHLDKAVVRDVLGEVARTVQAGVTVRIHAQRSRFAPADEPRGPGRSSSVPKRWSAAAGVPHLFRVRAWTPRELLRTFSALICPTRLTADGFFPADSDLLRPASAMVMSASVRLRPLTVRIPGLAKLADSVWLEATKHGAQPSA